ncbi:MAG: flavodoxin family protein [Lachnospiraceae bacterium]|nr:flavodoxin family protein [Candidatus Equihabitans merdae]
MSKVLLINGSPHEHGCTYTALKEVADTLNKLGVDTEIYHLGAKPLQPCTACGACKNLGECVFKDDPVNEIGARLDEFQGIIVGSPVYYGGPSGAICTFMDRFCYTYGISKCAGKLAASVVSCRRGGATSAFERLNQYFAMLNMPIVPSQYWNQIHGNTPEEALQDIEGLQTMRTLAQNMAWLLKCIEAGKAAGIEAPVYEDRTPTNFIH